MNVTVNYSEKLVLATDKATNFETEQAARAAIEEAMAIRDCFRLTVRVVRSGKVAVEATDEDGERDYGYLVRI